MKLIDPMRRPYLNLFLLTFLLAVLINSGSLDSSDAMNRLQVTHWIWQHVPQVTGQTAAGISAIGRNGQRYVTWGIGQSLVMLPGDILATELIRFGHLQRLAPVLDPGIVSYVTFPFLNALTICLACATLRELNFSLRQSILGALALLFGTTFLVYAQVQQENNLMLLCLLAGVWANLRWARSRHWGYLLLGALALGYDLLIRIPGIFDAAAVYGFVALGFVLRKRRENQPFARYAGTLVRYTLLFILLYLPFIAADRFYQWLRFDSVARTYTSIWGAEMRAANPALPPTFPFDVPFYQGFVGQFFSKDRSLLLFNPLVVLTLLMVIRFWRTLDAQLKLWFFAAFFLLVCDVALYSRWFEWGGAGAWGPRYALVASEYLSLIGLPILLKHGNEIRSGVEKTVYWALAGVSCMLQLLALLFDYGLELAQEQSFHTTYLVVWQRVVNSWLIATGSFKTSEIVPDLDPASLQKYTRLSFMPWRTEGELPAHASDIMQILWLIGAIVFITGLLTFLRRLSGAVSQA